ncbi:hypothetical protein CRM22_010181 [Opisthorchis felineus]|uniref:Uncharacterized protein n=1 Tax=Opisthorchis felineus TaxID=147828 RepID=A0A4S2L0Y1_OPIFE|nr:hypothetical protein CRM22_010181 [Opisthorchis felineus]
MDVECNCSKLMGAFRLCSMSTVEVHFTVYYRLQSTLTISGIGELTPLRLAAPSFFTQARQGVPAVPRFIQLFLLHPMPYWFILILLPVVICRILSFISGCVSVTYLIYYSTLLRIQARLVDANAVLQCTVGVV